MALIPETMAAARMTRYDWDYGCIITSVIMAMGVGAQDPRRQDSAFTEITCEDSCTSQSVPTRNPAGDKLRGEILYSLKCQSQEVYVAAD